MTEGATDIVLSDFFFSSRRRHTRCLSDWSSDVCSSDLRNGRQIVMFGHPIARKTEAIGEPREIEGIAQGLRCRGAGRNWRQIEDGQRDHRRRPTLTCERRLFARMIRRMITGTDWTRIDGLVDRMATAASGPATCGGLRLRS